MANCTDLYSKFSDKINDVEEYYRMFANGNTNNNQNDDDEDGRNDEEMYEISKLPKLDSELKRPKYHLDTINDYDEKDDSVDDLEDSNYDSRDKEGDDDGANHGAKNEGKEFEHNFLNAIDWVKHNPLKFKNFLNFINENPDFSKSVYKRELLEPATFTIAAAPGKKEEKQPEVGKKTEYEEILASSIYNTILNQIKELHALNGQNQSKEEYHTNVALVRPVAPQPVQVVVPEAAPMKQNAVQVKAQPETDQKAKDHTRPVAVVPEDRELPITSIVTQVKDHSKDNVHATTNNKGNVKVRNDNSNTGLPPGPAPNLDCSKIDPNNITAIFDRIFYELALVRAAKLKSMEAQKAPPPLPTETKPATTTCPPQLKAAKGKLLN